MDPLSMSASLITIGALAIQTISILQKTQGLCSSIRDTPRNLQSLLEELQLLSTLLSGFKNNASHPTYGTIHGFPDALEHCQHALRSIQAFSEDLEKSIDSAKHGLRYWASFKTLFTEKKMKSFLNRLERAKSMLSLAHQCCIQAQIMDVIHLQRQLLRKPPEYNAATCDRVQSWQLPELSKRDLEATSMTGSNIDGTSIRHRRNVSSRETSRYNLGFGVLSISRSKSKHTNPRQEVRWVEAQITELSFQPSTLHYFQRCFSVLCERSLGAWQYSLRTFSIFTTDDCIYYCCASGDLDRAKQLCREGRASPSSVTNNGFTLLHVAAAFAHADMCQWLLDVGVDVNVAAGSKWSATGHPIEFMQYEAGSTPLHAAVKCAGSIGILRPDKLDTGISQNDAMVLESVQGKSSTDYLNTLRVLVENGGDPMIANDHGDTVLHLHTGAAEQFRYLLRQEQSVIETSQPNYNGDTIAERHARWYWAEGPKRAKLAWIHEIAQRRELCRHGSNRPEAFPVTSKALLLHETNGHLRYFIKQGGPDFESALSLLRKLVAEGVDIHGVLDEGSEGIKTPLAQIPRIVSEIETSAEGFDRETRITSFAIGNWLKILEGGHVDLKVYAEEEERVIRSMGTEGVWELCEYDGSMEYRVDWGFETGNKASACSISARYVFRPVNEEPEELHNSEAQAPDLPGSWPDEAD